MQAVLDAEFGKDSDDCDEDDSPTNDLFCLACNKLFKSSKA